MRIIFSLFPLFYLFEYWPCDSNWVSKLWCFVEDFGFCTEISPIWNGGSFWFWSSALIKLFCALGLYSSVMSWNSTAKNQKFSKLGLYALLLCLYSVMMTLLHCWKNSLSAKLTWKSSLMPNIFFKINSSFNDVELVEMLEGDSVGGSGKFCQWQGVEVAEKLWVSLEREDWKQENWAEGKRGQFSTNV